MDSSYDGDVSLSIDMVEMGVRPMDWFDERKSFDYETKENHYQLNIYSAEFQPITTVELKDHQHSNSDDDDQDSNDYEIDPETGEKIYHEKSSTPSIFSPTNKWLDEYITNLESSSLPATTMTDDAILSNIPSTVFENVDPQWLNTFLQIDENSETNLFHEVFPLEDEQQSNITSISADPDVSFISSTKLEKIDPDDADLSQHPTPLPRPTTQTQQDEETLIQYHIPLTIEQITQSSTEEYNQHLSGLGHLSAEQMHIIKDIRRRGKNKIAAQNCRKRKAVGVEALLEEVDELKRVKQELEERKKAYEKEIAETRRQYEYLHRQVLPHRQLLPAIRVK